MPSTSRLVPVFVSGMLVGAVLLAVAIHWSKEDTSPDEGAAVDSPVPAPTAAAPTVSVPQVAASEPTPGGQAVPASITVSPLGALAASDPLAALDAVLAIEGKAQRERALFDAAAVWAANDSTEALDAIRAIPDAQLRVEMMTAALFTWSIEDVVAMFRYIASVDDWDLSVPGVQGPDNIQLRYMVENRRVDFRELAALVDDMSPPFDRTLRRAVVNGLAQQDPVAATEFFETLPEDEKREAGTRIAQEYARSDPLAAFEWARASGEPRLMEGVLRAIADSDALGAVDLALQTDETAHLLSVVRVAVRNEALALDEIASVLAALPASSRREQALEAMTQGWAVREPERTLEWLVAQGDTVSPALFRIVAGRLQNPDLAASYADRVPPAARTAWIQTAAEGLASTDPDGALQWIAQFRDQPAYAPSVASIAFYMAAYDGPGAADLLRRASVENDASAVSRVARAWAARSDPKAVVDWLQTLANEGVRSAALGDVARIWEYASPDEAERWVLSLRSGEERDAILYSMISASFVTGSEPSDTLFRAYSNDSARQVAAVNAARSIEPNNGSVARRLLDRYVTDPEIRRQYESGGPLPPTE